MAAIIFNFVVVGITCLFFCFIAHLIWVWGSRVFRTIFGPYCPSCHAPLDSNGYCTDCLSKARLSESKPTLEKDLLAVNRLLQHAQSERLLNETQLAFLKDCILTLSVANKKQAVADDKSRVAPTLPSPSPVVTTQRTVVNQTVNSSTPNAIAPAKPGESGGSPLEETKIPGFTPMPPSLSTPAASTNKDTRAPLQPAESTPPSVPEIAKAIATSSLPKIPEPITTLTTPTAPMLAANAHSIGEVHPLDAPDDPLDQSKSRKLGLPKIKESTKAFTAEMIWSFMEKSNIRWMELVGAALVVICSAGLVISLWSKLSETNRFFPSVVFMVATLAVHGMGQYTLKKWKLRDTSRGILNIAMMLIPMSVMTGILLSKKESQLELGFQFYAVLTIGLLIYGTLAVTAAKSLFNSSWFPVATTTVVSSLSLVPLYIHCNSETGWYRIEFLLPAVAALTAFVWDLSVSSAYRRLRTEGYYRRQLAMLVHLFFAAFSVIIFWWYLRPSSKPEFPSLFWALLGISGTAVSSWGFINGKLRLPGNLFGLAPTSLTSTDSERERYTKPGLSNASPFVVGSWVIGIAAILMTFFSLSRIFDHRTEIVCLFAGMALWLGSFGWIAHSPLSMAIAGLLGILASLFSIERIGFGIRELSWEDWISFERVVTLGAIGTAVATIAALLQPMLHSWERNRTPHLSLGPQSWFDRWSRRLNDSEIASFMITSGVGTVLSAAILSFLATFIPVGRTPYGGTWAPSLVLTYGVVSTLVGLLKIRSMPYLLPIAQGLTVYATIRLSAHAERLPEVLLALPAHQRTALGLAFIACIWSMIYAVGSHSRFTSFAARFMELINLRESKVFRSLGESAGGLAILPSLAMWYTEDHLLEVTKWGWTLPLTLALVWIAREKTWFREGTLGALMLWSSGAFHYLGNTRGWWSHLDHFTTAVLHALLITVLLFIFERFLNAGKRTHRVSRWFQGESGLAFDTCNAILCLFLTLGIGLVSATLYTTTWSQVDWSTLDLQWIPATNHGRTLQFAITTTTLVVFAAWLTWYSSRARTFNLIHFWGIVPALAAALFCSLGMSADLSVLSSLVAFGAFGIAQAVAGGILSNRRAMNQAIVSKEPTETLLTIENTDSWFNRLLQQGFGHFIMASGYSTVMLGAILSLMSMQSAWGNSEFGSKWLPIFVFVYSWGILLAGLLRIQTSQYFIPIGQVLGLIATIKLTGSTSWMPQWLIDVGPLQSSAIGASALACVWATLYTVASRAKIHGISLYQKSFQTASCVQFLGESSILVASIANSVFWMTNSQEHFQLVTHWGWCMPLVFLLVWIARERSYARDGLVAGLMLWGQGALHHVGYELGWWDGTGTFTITMIHVVFACACLFAIDLLVAQLRRSNSLAPWLHDEMEWSYGICNSLLLLVLMFGIASISIPQIIGGLTGISSESIRFHWHPSNTLEMRNAFSTGMMALGLYSAWLSRIMPRMQLSSLPGTQGIALCLAASLFSLVGSPAQGVIASLWVFAFLSVGSEVWQHFQGRSPAIAKRREFMRSQSTSDGIPRILWQDVTRVLSVIALMFITTAAIILAWSGAISPELQAAIRGDDWAATATIPRILSIARWMAPLTLVAIWYWLLPTIYRRDSATIQSCGFFAANLLFLSSFMVLFDASNTLFGQVIIAVKALSGVFALFSLATQLIPLGIDSGKSTASPRKLHQLRDELVSKSNTGESVGFIDAGWNMALISASFLLTIVLFAFADNVLHAVAPTGTKNIVDTITLVVFSFSIGAILFNGWLYRVGAGPMLMVAMATAAPLIPQLDWLKDFLLRGWGATPTANGAIYKAEPLHAMLILWLIALAVSLLRPSSRRGDTHFTALEDRLCNTLAVIVGVLAMWQGSATNTWWTCAILFPLSVIILLTGLVRGTVGHGHFAAAIAGAGILLVRTKPPFSNFNPFMVWDILVGPLAIGLISLGWILIAQWKQTKSFEGTESYFKLPIRSGVTVDQTISLHLPIAMIFWSLFALLAQRFGYTIEKFEFTFAFVAVLGSMVLSFGRIWDWRSHMRGWSIYLNGLSVAFVIAIAINQAYRLTIDDAFLVWAISGLVAMTTVAVMLREWLRESNSLIPSLRLGSLAPRQEEFERARVWMVGFHSAIGLLILVPIIGMAFYHPEAFTRRLTSLFPWVISLSILPIATDLRQQSPRVIALFLITFGAYLVGWSDFTLLSSGGTPSVENWWQAHRVYAYLQRAFAISIGVAWAFHYASRWLWEKLDWGTLLNGAGLITLCAGGTTGIVTLGLERGLAGNTVPNFVGITSIIAWLGLFAWTLQIALRPSPSQPQYSIPARRFAFYICEASLLAFASTLHFHFPELFGGILQKWWPIIVYALAITSIGLGELFHRKDHPVLSVPLFHNSLLLPLVPLLGVWLPQTTEYSIGWRNDYFYLLLLSTSIAYGAQGALRGLTALRVIAGAFLLASFWSALWLNESLSFASHPQLWIVPPAIAALIFVETNRKSLSAEVCIATRYIAILLIYCSSTVEMLMRSFQEINATPLILMVLALAGIGLGIALRVRAFLYCGSVFLFIALIGMVWNAQQAIDSVWPWWVFGIATGVFLIAILGYFEKNRSRFLTYAEKLRSWQP